jgi:hypothetical protein
MKKKEDLAFSGLSEVLPKYKPLDQIPFGTGHTGNPSKNRKSLSSGQQKNDAGGR